MNWHDFIAGIYKGAAGFEVADEGGRAPQPSACKPDFYPAASVQEIADAEVRLNATFPFSYRSLLSQTNGVMEMMAIDGGEWFDNMWLLWPVSEVVERNSYYRAQTEKGTYSRDFRKLVFFADAGCDGILFGFPSLEKGACGLGVVVWHPIEDELTEIAPSLEVFLTGWLTGAISV